MVGSRTRVCWIMLIYTGIICFPNKVRSGLSKAVVGRGHRKETFIIQIAFMSFPLLLQNLQEPTRRSRDPLTGLLLSYCCVFVVYNDWCFLCVELRARDSHDVSCELFLWIVLVDFAQDLGRLQLLKFCFLVIGLFLTRLNIWCVLGVVWTQRTWEIQIRDT